VKYAHIEQQVRKQGNMPTVVAHLRAFGLSKAGYYDYKARQDRPVAPSQLELDSIARHAHHRARQSYGARRLQAELAELGHKRSLATIKRMRKRLGLVCPGKRRWVRTTDSSHDLPIAPNLLQQRFDQAQSPNEVWVTDITYIDTDEGWLYLAGVKDLFTKRLVGWAMDSHMETSLVIQALQMAITTQRPPRGLIHHSDRGSQYASHQYRALLAKHHMQASMSRRANCYDNAAMESFWASLKKEQVHHQHYKTREEAKADVFGYIEGFYNPSRRHSSLGNVSPMEFERQHWAQQQASAQADDKQHSEHTMQGQAGGRHSPCTPFRSETLLEKQPLTAEQPAAAAVS
jgi:putative transposase